MSLVSVNRLMVSSIRLLKIDNALLELLVSNSLVYLIEDND